MVAESKYNKYLIEDIKRINSRFCLIRSHGESYVVDYYDIKKLRDFFPVSTIYNNSFKKAWDIYDVSNSEDEFNVTPIPWFDAPSSVGVFGAIVLFPLFSQLFLLLSFPISILLILVCLGGLLYLALHEIRSSKRILYQLKKFSKYQMIPVVKKKRTAWFSNGIALGISVLLVILFAFSIKNLSTLYISIVFLLLISWALGSIITGVRYIPDKSIKYQIIENEEK